MSPFGIFRKIGKLIRGGAGPVPIVLSCLLGAMLGMAPGFSATTVILIALILFLNVNAFLAGIAAMLGKALCLLLAPLTFHIGYFLIHKIGLEGLFAAASETPVVALMDLHVYCLIGGLPVAILLGLVLGVVLARLTGAARRKIAGMVKAHQPIETIGKSFWTRLLLWLMFGRQKEALEAMGTKPQSLFRKGRLIPAAILLVAIMVADVALADRFFRSAIENDLAQAVGAEVNVRAVRVSLLGAEMEIEGLQITDPRKPTHNLVQIERLASDLSIRSLLAKRVVLNELSLVGVALDQPRATPGKVYPKPAAQAAPPATAPAGTEVVYDYFEKAKELRKYEDYLKKLQEWLQKNREAGKKEPQPGAPASAPAVGPPPPADAGERLAEEGRTHGYLRLSAKDLIADRPAVTIRTLAADTIKVPDSPAVYSLRGRNLSNAPAKNPEDMAVEITSNKGFAAKLVLRYSAPGLSHEVALHVPDIDLKEWQLSDKAPVRAERGTGDVDAAGRFDYASIDLGVRVVTHNMKLAARPGRGMLGQDAGTSSKWADYLSDMTFAVALRGPLDSPHLVIDDKAMLAAIQDSLAKAGQKVLADQAGQAAQKALSQLGTPDIGKALPGGIGGLLGGPKPPPTSQPAQSQPKPPRLPDGLLPRLNRP